MNLNEMNNSYDEYTLTEEYYLEEGLKIFKKSKKLFKYADRIQKAVAKAETKKKVSPAEVSRLKALATDITKLADEFQVIEDDFAKGNVDRKVSKGKIKRVEMKNAALLAKLKKDEMKQTFKKIGMSALIVGLLATVQGLGMAGLLGGVSQTAAGVGARSGAYAIRSASTI